MRNVMSKVVVACLLCGASTAQGAPASVCHAEITEPVSGARVNRQGWVHGTAKVPNGGYLWVLAHMQALKDDYWPQGRGPAQVVDGQWRVMSTYGEPRDTGENFEIVAVVVGENDHKALQDWVKRAPREGYPPTTLPDPLPGCAYAKRVVEKVSH